MLLVFLATLVFLTIIYDAMLYILLSKHGVNHDQLSSLAALLIAPRMYVPFASLLVTYTVTSGLHSFLEYLHNWFRVDYGVLAMYLSTPIYVFIAVYLFFYTGFKLGVVDEERFKKLYGETTVKNLVVLGTMCFTAGLTVNTVFALGEEIGWRAYLFTYLDSVVGFQNSLIATGVIWGLWHIPLYIVLSRAEPNAIRQSIGFLALYYIVLCTLLSIPLSKLLILSGSVLVPSSLHGSINTLWRSTIDTLKEDLGVLGWVKVVAATFTAWLPAILYVLVA